MIAYHGSTALFEAFDADHAMSGIGKMKFGWGTYLSEKESTCVHYATKDAEKRSDPDSNYVYKVEVPDKTEGNYIEWDVPVSAEVVGSVNKKLSISLPEGVKAGFFYKAIVDFFKIKYPRMNKKEREAWQQRDASLLFSELGIIGMAYPRNWKAAAEKRIGDYNFVIFNPANLRVISVTRYAIDKTPLMYKEL